MQRTRRAWLGALGAAGAAALAGCGGVVDGLTGGGTPSGPGPPASEGDLYVGHELDVLNENITDGGVPKDGIPSVDEPEFQPADAASLADGDVVFGVERGGEAKAYPQYILVHHEIVNDTVGGDPVAVTYCPLTGTAQGFERGETTFGVSGRLVNSNLTMYDRDTDSWWPQVVATAIRGPRRGETLSEFRVVWTTWGEWRGAHPDTVVLTEETGYQRRYGSDPYGQYNPPRGYYTNDETLFEPLVSDDRVPPKRVVIGTRTDAGALAFDKQALLSERVLTGSIDGTDHVAVADATLSTGYVYANPDSVGVEPGDGGYRVGGEVHASDALPLERVLAFDGMWFAWAGFYPELPYVR
ncbi:DUF3179 domain-containing protein [Haloarcula salinisoli]|uniref:DUF3179 domain-containing protein n=1 Tax=Haloarcula salinisoli TaxID=2487746 RepID=A0A8J7YJD9_9EURY|nr:DUF3179 domain-containing protein [Halomicroarcula salinisoli]MBX0284702.1 DUF3179 domain-containing protein [Halomicroarcula salinisoli]MBX0303814.1 DUF3179 domain-containing protein [Halomicroarcula salinisoli]